MKPPVGWSPVYRSLKWHYFLNRKSLCRRYVLTGKSILTEGADDADTNCKLCMKRLKKLRERKHHHA